jgi:hypothetical protein
MTSEEAKKYLDGSISINEISQPSSEDTNIPPADHSSNGEAGSEESNTDTQLETPNSDDKPPEERTATVSEDGKPDDKGNPNQPVETDKPKDKQHKPKEEKLPYPNASKDYVEKYKANKAFIRQKEKFKAKIGAMQSQIDDLKAQLMKANSVDTSKIEDEDKRLDFKMAKNTLKTKLEGLEEQRQNAINEQEEAEAEQIHQQRVDSCFDDENSKSHYLRLLENGREKFVNFLSQYDPQNTILSYLDDSELSPLMVQVLMTNPDVLKRVVSIKNPLNKVVELRSIENRIAMDRRLRSVKNPRNTQQATNSPAKKLPSTGSQTQAGAGKDPNPVRDSNYWRNYLATHS